MDSMALVSCYLLQVSVCDPGIFLSLLIHPHTVSGGSEENGTPSDFQNTGKEALSPLALLVITKWFSTGDLSSVVALL